MKQPNSLGVKIPDEIERVLLGIRALISPGIFTALGVAGHAALHFKGHDACCYCMTNDGVTWETAEHMCKF